jgi:hypothetical protein
MQGRNSVRESKMDDLIMHGEMHVCKLNKQPIIVIDKHSGVVDCRVR